MKQQPLSNRHCFFLFTLILSIFSVAGVFLIQDSTASILPSLTSQLPEYGATQSYTIANYLSVPIGLAAICGAAYSYNHAQANCNQFTMWSRVHTRHAMSNKRRVRHTHKGHSKFFLIGDNYVSA